MSILKSYFLVSLIFLISAGSIYAQPVPEPAQNASSTNDEIRALIKKIETQHRGLTSHSITQMNISTKDWKRSLKMENWSEGRDKFLVKINSPAKEKGTCTLKIQGDIWNFLPKIDRLVKIPSSLMGDKWMGSHFTNDDLVKEDKIDLLYDFSVEKKTEKIIGVLAIPKPNAAVVWGKLLYTIDREKEVPVSIDYFDEDGVKVRLMVFDNVQFISNRWVPLRMKIEPVEAPTEFTELVYESVQFDIQLQPNLFSLQSLRKR